MTIHPIVWLHKISAVLLATSSKLGIWGLGGIALIDSGLVPLPMDPAIVMYVARDHRKFLLYCLIAAFASSIGSLVPYYIGRAGGELFLLKRINRERYEAMRDRFERQEFMVMMVSAMMPPPMPVKVFEFGAGVFEMKPLPFSLAIFVGKFVQFLVFSLLTIWFGPEIVHTAHAAIHQHPAALLLLVVTLALGLAIYMLRKLFDRRRGAQFPIEANLERTELVGTVENDDSTLIT